MAKVELDVAKMVEETFEEHFGVTLDRLRELAEADKAGRCVVLPCKVGDTLYEPYVDGTDQAEVNEIAIEICTRMGVYNQEDFGKTVFLTREAAEKALEDMK